MKRAQFMIIVNALIASAIGLYFFIVPAILSIYYTQDQALESHQVPKLAIDMHERISPQVVQWATHRVDQRLGRNMSSSNISGTEWPFFSALYYLWTTELLIQDYQKRPTAYTNNPSVYSRKAVRAAIQLITDPNHASWVRQKWGEDYLKKENVFYRAMLIAGADSYYRITGNDKYQHLLKSQTARLSQELLASPTGLLDDYPGECYPSDVAFAYLAIKRAHETLGLTDSITATSSRAFTEVIDKSTSLPPFSVGLDPDYPPVISPARGSATAWFMHAAPQLWPEAEKQWMTKFEQHFWQHSWTAWGFREFQKNAPSPNAQWGFDIDAGPVLAGHGFSASTFGIGAARLFNRVDMSFPMTAEMIVMSVPHIKGNLLLPQALSDLSDAPLVGELSILYNLSLQPLVRPREAAAILPLFFYLVNGFYWLMGFLIIWRGIRRTKRGRNISTKPSYLLEQMALWMLLIGISGYLFYTNHSFSAVGVIIVSRLFPILTMESKK